MKAKNLIKGFAAAVCLAACSMQVQAAPIPVELILAIDESGSIGSADFEVQRAAYISVLSSSLITTDGNIAIGLVTFASSAAIDFGLQVIDSQAKKDSLIAAVTALVYSGGGTNIAAAVSLGSSMLAGLDFANGNEIIDVATDGVGFVGTSVTDANAAGRTVNCLEIGGNSNCDWNEGGLDFVAGNFAELEAALTRKIRQETGQVDVPAPATLGLLGMGMAMFGFATRRRGKNA